MIIRSVFPLSPWQSEQLPTVEQLITEIYEKFNLQGVWHDPFQAEYLAQSLRGKGINMIRFDQISANLEAAASNLLRLVNERNIVSYPSDELRTAIANCRSVETIRGLRISKTVGSRKIDLAAALSFAALATVREQRAEPGIIGYYRWLSERNHDGAPPSVDDEERNELIKLYKQGHPDEF